MDQFSATGGSGASPPSSSHRDLWSPKNSTFFRQYIGPLLLIFICPIFIQLLYFIYAEHDGSIVNFVYALQSNNPSINLLHIFPSPDPESVKFLVIFIAFELVLFLVVPGEKFDGPVAPSGMVPHYWGNGLQCWALTMIAWVLGSDVCLNLYSSHFIYDHLGPLMTLLNLTALLLCLLLYFKGKYYPSSADSGSNGTFIMDFYWGMELYPQLLGIHLKQFLICRFGMMLWCLFVVNFAFKTVHNYGSLSDSQLTSSFLLFSYIAKFFYWERWYLSAADIQVDRFGFMLCWGTMCFMPLVHTLQNLFLTNHNPEIPLSPYFIIFLGTLMTFFNYDSDTQRHRVRQSNGNCTIWWGRWKKKPRIIRATYKTFNNEVHKSILLVDGYHGIVRHFHYLPDIVNLFLYSLPCGFTHLLNYTYFIYLTTLLVDRTKRIDERCKEKYGTYWDLYCKDVPYRLIPGLF